MSGARLAGKFALVTGGASGIGRAVAERFAAGGAVVGVNHLPGDTGAAAALAALAAGSAAHGHGAPPHRALPADIAEAAACQRLIAACLAAWGRLDILVNNAGMLPRETASHALDPADFARTLAVNLVGAAHLSSLAIQHFLSRSGGGVIVNTTSVHAAIPKPGYAGYAVSKSGLDMLTRTLALEYADRGIRVNAVGPGAVETPMNDAWRHDPVQRAAVARHIPMGHAAKPEDIAGVYAFLASDDARYVTGQTIYACGGVTLHADFKHNWSS